MRKQLLFAAIVVLIGTEAQLFAATPEGNVQGALSRDELSFTGITPGGDMVLFGIAVHTSTGVLTKYPFALVVSDTDRDGAVDYKPRGGVPLRSLWFAADLENGSFAVLSPEGYELKHREIENRSVKKDTDGLVEALELERGHLEVLLVRPGKGAWILRVREGTSSDGDRVRDGRLTVLFDEATPLGETKEKAPKKLKSGDILAVLDPGHLDLRTLTVTR
jgi:hypothetical protein